MTRWQQLRQHLASGLGAGLVAGALVGGVEVAWLIGHTGRLDTIAALAYAVLAYGLLGAVAGLALSLPFGVWQRPNHPTDRWSLYISLTSAALLMPIAAYRALTDWQLEQVGQVLAAGLIGLGCAGLFPLLRRVLHQRSEVPVVRLSGSAALYLCLVLAAGLLSGVPTWLASVANLVAPSPSGIPPDLRDKPNVILIVADTLRADRLSCYGYAENQTPHLDALARDGVLYRQMSAQASWTKPSVATIFTSLYPSSHQAINAESQLPAAVTTLAEVLHERSYRTAGFTTNAYVTPWLGFDQGFDSYTYLEPDDLLFAPLPATQLTIHRALMWVYHETDLGRWQRQILGTYPGLYYRNAEVVNRDVLPWLEAHRDQRFFLYVHYMDPHMPYFRHPYDGTAFIDPLPPDQAPLVSSLYDGEVAYLDAHLGELFDALKTWNLYDDTLIVFTADHGEELFEHGGWGHGATLYEEQLRVPLIVKYPQQAPAGTVDEGIARSLDLAPTVLDVIGVPAPAAMQGVSLQPGENAPARATILFAETVYLARYPMEAVRVGMYKLLLTAPGHPRLIPSPLLFDLSDDPGEHRNLAEVAPDTLAALRAELDRVMAFAETHAVAGQAGELDAATRERLRQLGY